MFERFTDEARRVIVLAQEEARELGHDYIGTEHLLLGLARENEGVAAKALASLNISLAAIQAQVAHIVGEGEPNASGHIPFTPRAKEVLEGALREALQFNHRYIGPEHLLLALIREGSGVGAQALQQLGVTLPEVRSAVLGLIDGMEDTGDEGLVWRDPAADRETGWTGYIPMVGAHPPGGPLRGAWRRLTRHDELPDLRNADLIGMNLEWPAGQLILTMRHSPEALLRMTVYGVTALSLPRAQSIVPGGTIKEATLASNEGLIELTIKMKNRESFTVCGESFEVETFGWA